MKRGFRSRAAATSTAQPSRTNTSRSMTTGRSCIGSSTPSMTGRLMSGSTVSTSSPASAAAPEVPLAQRARSVPRPRAHLTRCQGVFAPNFKPRHVGMTDPERGPAKDELADSRGNSRFRGVRSRGPAGPRYLRKDGQDRRLRAKDPVKMEQTQSRRDPRQGVTRGQGEANTQEADGRSWCDAHAGSVASVFRYRT